MIPTKLPLVVDMRRALERAAPMSLDVRSLAPEELAVVQEHWRIHMVAEFASSRVFSALVPQLMRAELDYEYVRQATDMARQEVEHGLLSAQVYVALGGNPRAVMPDLADVPAHEVVSHLEAVLRNVISISCAGETLAVAVIGAERERAQSEPLRHVLSQILRDEVYHARFGWKLLAEVAPGLDTDARRRTSAYLVAVFERDLRALAPSAGLPLATDAALALGAPDGASQWAMFWQTMTEVTVPGLDNAGLCASWAWERAVRNVTAQAA